MTATCAKCERRKDAQTGELIAELTQNLSQKGYNVEWLPDLQTVRKFIGNTNIRRIDDTNHDLGLKTVDELIKELEPCGKSLVLMLRVTQDELRSRMLFYDRGNN